MRRYMVTSAILAAITAALVFIIPSASAEAHKLSIYAYLEGAKVHSESYYFDGSECKDCSVKVVDPLTNKEILSGRTDDDGIFIFNKPRSLPVRIELNAGQGHIASFVLEEERPDNTYSRKNDADAEGEMLDASVMPPQLKALPVQQNQIISEYDVDAAVEEKIKPLKEEVERLRRKVERPGVTEILGGIGYIAGLAGLWMYMQSRKKH